MTAESLMSIGKENLAEAAAALAPSDISQLVEMLSLKDDKIRYQAFLLLQCRSRTSDDVYPHWDAFRIRLQSDNSYQRSLGLMMIAENVKWDRENRMEDCIGDFLALLKDEKPVTQRQCIQALEKIAAYKPALRGRITESLLTLNLNNARETMRKSLLTDIVNVLLAIREDEKSDEADLYIRSAIKGGLLDKKTAKSFAARLE